MKTLFVRLFGVSSISAAFLVSATASAAQSFKLECNAPTDIHPASLSISVDPASLSAAIRIGSANRTSETFTAKLQQRTVGDLNNSLLSRTVVLVGYSPDSWISGNDDAYTKAVSLVLMQKTQGLAGSQTAILTRNNTVTIHTCSKK